MVILEYNHAFTLKQLQVIITQYLQLGPYNTSLQSAIKSYMNKYLSLPLQQRHNQQHQHPIKLPINFYKYTNSQSGSIDRDSYSGEYEYIYPLQVLVQIMQSSEFYESLPKNIIINHLLTTTNISIIIQTLTILSQNLSKLIKSTLDSVEDKRVTELISSLVSDCIEKYDIFDDHENQENKPQKRSSQQKNQFQSNFPQNTDSESEIQTIRIQSQFQLNKNTVKSLKFNRKVTKKESIIANLLKKQDLSHQNPKSMIKNLKSLLIEDQMLRPLWLIGQEDDNNLNLVDRFSTKLMNLEKSMAIKPKQFTICQYCLHYRSYLIESTGLSYFDLHEISRIPSQLYKVLRRIKDVINVFTLYLKETNRTTVPANINVVNKILASIELVITEDVWENGSLNPSMKKKSNEIKKVNKKVRPLIKEMQPYFDQVYNYKSHDPSQFTIDQLLNICLKASELKDVQKTLIEKHMNEARLKKQGKDIQTLCLTKQNLVKNNHSDSNHNAGEKPFEDVKNTGFQYVLDEIQLLREYEKQQAIINRAFINSRPIYTQINSKYQDEVTMGTEIRRHKMESNRVSQNKQVYQKSQIIKDLSKHNEDHENEKFKMIMYQQYLKNQGFNVTKNNISGIISKNLSKAKSMNCLGKDIESSIEQSFFKHQTDDFIIPNNNPSQFTRRAAINTLSVTNSKNEQDGPSSYQKKQTQIYNKMLLNGEVIKNQVSNEIQFGKAVIYQSMEDFLKKLEELNAEAEKQQEEEVSQMNDDKVETQKLFLTVCGPNLRKTSTGIKKTQTMKKQQSLKVSRKTDLLNATKTPKSNFQTKFSSLSNTKHAKLQTYDKFNQPSNQKLQSRNQVSINEIPFRGWIENVQIKKPDWLDQFVTKTGQQNIERTKPNTTQKLLQNQRFKEFQQKCLLRQCLSASNLQKNVSEKQHRKQKNIFEKRKLKESKTMTNLKRPVSAFCGPPKNATATVKCLGRTLCGKRRSYIMSKQFELDYNSILTKIYKENMEYKNFGSLQRELHQEKVFEDLKKKIEKGKFTVDKFFN